MPNLISRWIMGRAERLRFPFLFGVAALLFIIDLFVPDAVPLIDELLLGLVTLLFGSWKKTRRDKREAGRDTAGEP